MREILFRGKSFYDGEWTRGWYCEEALGKWPLVPCIIPSELARNGELKHEVVDTETVGQFTGLTDKNGAKIFEGDVVRMHYFFENFDTVTFGVFEDETEIVCKLSITPLGVVFESANMSGYLRDYLEEPEEELEVVGNIYDNPELLEVSN